MKRPISICLISLLVNTTQAATLYPNEAKQIRPRLSSISRLLMGAPHVVINIEHLNVDRPKELNVNIAQKEGKSSKTKIPNKIEKISTNTTETAVRQNDRFMKNFYSESLTQAENTTIVEPENERKNITYFIHKLLNKRDSSYKSKIAHFKNHTVFEASKRKGKELHVKVNKNIPMDSNITKIVENLAQLQNEVLINFKDQEKIPNFRKNKDICNDKIRESISRASEKSAKDYQRTARNIHSLVNKQLFQPFESSLIENEIGNSKETSRMINNQNITEDTAGLNTVDKTDNEKDKLITVTDMTKDNDKDIAITKDTNITKVIMTTTPLIDRANKIKQIATKALNPHTNDKITENKIKGEIDKSDFKDTAFGSPCTADISTNKQKLIANITDQSYNCETAKTFLKKSCDEEKPDVIQQQVVQHFEDISDFFQFHDNNQTIDLKNGTDEKCCTGNHVLDILKMLNRIISATNKRKQFTLFQARHLKTKKDSWLFKMNKHEVILTNTEIFKIKRHGFEAYHNHIDGFELFECKIFGRCESEVRSTEKNKKRQEMRKERRQQEKKWKQYRKQND